MAEARVGRRMALLRSRSMALFHDEKRATAASMLRRGLPKSAAAAGEMRASLEVMFATVHR